MIVDIVRTETICPRKLSEIERETAGVHIFNSTSKRDSLLFQRVQEPVKVVTDLYMENNYDEFVCNGCLET